MAPSKTFSNKQKKVLVWGTFDLLHEGHLEFLRNASKLGALNVIIVPDKIVYKNKRRYPINSELLRKAAVENLPFVSNVFIDCMDDGLNSLDVIAPDIFCMGYDQRTKWEKQLIALLHKKNTKFSHKVLGKYARGIHTRHIIRQVINRNQKRTSKVQPLQELL